MFVIKTHTPMKTCQFYNTTQRIRSQSPFSFEPHSQIWRQWTKKIRLFLSSEIQIYTLKHLKLKNTPENTHALIIG